MVFVWRSDHDYNAEDEYNTVVDYDDNDNKDDDNVDDDDENDDDDDDDNGNVGKCELSSCGQVSL